jgi:hypothetical protein
VDRRLEKRFIGQNKQLQGKWALLGKAIENGEARRAQSLKAADAAGGG